MGSRIRARALPVMTVIVAIAIAGIASASGGAIATKIHLVDAIYSGDGNQDAIFFGHVDSPRAVCEGHRKMTFAKRAAGTTDPFEVVDTDVTSRRGAFAGRINVTDGPDVRLVVRRKVVDLAGHLKTCARASHTETAG